MYVVMYKMFMPFDNYTYVACRFTELMQTFFFFYIEASGKHGRGERGTKLRKIFSVFIPKTSAN